MTHESTAYERLCVELRSIAAALGTPRFQIGHRALAHAIGCSAARIPAFMGRLEYQGLITRKPLKNCYQIDVSPLIDHPPTPDRSPLIDHPQTPDRSPLIDHSPPLIDQGSGQAAQQTITPDRSPLIDHPQTSRAIAHQGAAHQGTATARSHARVLEPTTTESLNQNLVAVVTGGDARGGSAPPAAQLMAELGANPKIIRLAYEARPDWTPQQVRQRWEYDQRRIAASDGALHEGVFFTALRSGEMAPARADPAAPLNPAAYAGDSLYRLGSDVRGLDPPPDAADLRSSDLAPPAADEPPPESVGDHARRLLPTDASTADWVFVQTRLARGDSDDGALAALAERRRR